MRAPLASLALALLVAAPACGDNTTPREVPTSDELYDPTTIWDLHLTLSDDALASLRRSPRAWVRGDVSFQGVPFANVGVRLKGTFSFRPIDDKPALRLKFGQYVPGARFLGLPSLTLNNLTQDRTLTHEALSYRIFRDLGVPAARSGYVHLSINDDDYGLYANVEPVNGHFLAQWFGDDDGPLFEAGIGHDVVPEDVALFEHDEGEDDRVALAELAAWATDPARDVFFDPASPLDREAFFAMIVGEIITSQWDGYHKPNNYYLYRDPTTSRWAFIPWGLDQTWERTLAPYAHDSQLLDRCFDEPACLAAFAAHAAATAATLDAATLDELLDQVDDAIDDVAAADDRKPYPMAKYLRHRVELRAAVPAAVARLAAAGACVADGLEVDADADGFGACLADCDDASTAAHPGGVEVCDGLDNDCDGLVDELAACPCDDVELGEAHYLLCTQANSWSGAAAQCSQRGGTLATIADAATNAALFAATQAARPGRWYVGANDTFDEGVFRWADGSAAAFTAWPPGEPDDYGEEDCVTLDPVADGGWTDQRCGEVYPFVCSFDEDE